VGVDLHLMHETRVPKEHPLRAIRAIANSAQSEMRSDFVALYAFAGPPFDSTGEAAACLVVAGFLLDPLGTSADERLEFEKRISARSSISGRQQDGSPLVSQSSRS
jgi:hypothetical protein